MAGVGARSLSFSHLCPKHVDLSRPHLELVDFGRSGLDLHDLGNLHPKYLNLGYMCLEPVDLRRPHLELIDFSRPGSELLDLGHSLSKLYNFDG
ncbi:hypothetical protein GUJ93_ZPchr0001g32362 [Zizania palustris]|uniref:Uncharacterized protein n=1 Tax=Zizania palustris TaxID=103762 RepID=A0A8J5RF78_ZIZPA|nr:hypothetical protein GUJ93_ZPchr0001g32362 [Zizania palustris]